MERVAKDVEGHVVFAGPWTSVQLFLMQLRAPHLSEALRCRPVVVLHDERPVPHVWDGLSKMAEIYWVEGDPKNTFDLRRAAMHRAVRAVQVEHIRLTLG